MKLGYKSKTQQKNLAWYLPRPAKYKYKGGMPLYCEDWLIQLAKELLNKNNIMIINLFSGGCQQGLTIDIKSEVKPDLVADAHNFSNKLEGKKFDFVLADPPYSTEESQKLYETGKLNYKKWTAECDKVLKTGGLLCVYHKYIMPNPNPEKYEVVKRVFIGNRIYHLLRAAIYFRKKC